MKPIFTPRLILKPLTEHDLEPLHRLTGSDRLMRYISGAGNTVEETQARLIKDLGYHSEFGFGLCLCDWRETGEVIGRAGIIPHPTESGLEGELAWLFAEEWWGRGLATEVATALIDHGRSLGLSRIFALANPKNVASIRVMQKLGMAQVHSSTSEVEYQLLS
jgi:ribosomal-protein-alanine N-acetyltransferase